MWLQAVSFMSLFFIFRFFFVFCAHSQVFSYDFIGIEPDETSDSSTALHVPSSWAPLFEGPDAITLITLVLRTVPLVDTTIKVRFIEFWGFYLFLCIVVFVTLFVIVLSRK
jgi:hypothetical protein